MLKMNVGEKKQHTNYLISWISEYGSIYYKKSLKSTHVSKRIKELIRLGTSL